MATLAAEPALLHAPNGAAGSDTSPRLSPIIPASRRLDTLSPRPMSRVKT